MIRLLGLAVTVVTVALIPLGAEGRNLSGNWESQVMGTRVVVHVDQMGQAISGVAYVYSPLGRKNTYHFRGLIKGRQVRLGIEAPPETSIHRQEIFLKIKEANEQATAVSASDLDRLSGLFKEKGEDA